MKKITHLAYIFFVLAVFTVSLTSCTKQQKAEKSVSNFIKKFSTNPDTYEPIEFLSIEKSSTEFGSATYQISHMYRIVGADGQRKVMSHTFKVTEGFNVIVEPFERFD